MRKIFWIFVLVLLAFSVFFLFGKTDSPTGNAVLENNVVVNDVEAQKVPAPEVKEVTLSKPKPNNIVKSSAVLKPDYVLYQMLKEDSENNQVVVHYKINSNHRVELMMFPTRKDLINYAELKNLDYDRYACTGIGTSIEGSCLVDDVGFSIWNSDGGLSADVSYEFTFTKGNKSFRITLVSKPMLARRLLNS